MVLYVASAFSKDHAGGNKAGVVLLQGYDLDDAEKTRIAYQLGYSETAFVTRSDEADYNLEYFTPAGEVPLCGHATIGTFVVLKHLNMLKKSEYTIETKSGILRITINDDGLIFMQQNTPQFYDEIEKYDVESCFDIDLTAGNLPIQIVSTGLRDILVPVNTLADLEKMTPDFTAISKISQDKECVGIHAFSLVHEEGLTAVCRNFAPLYGIPEEAATGTSNCALACYLHRYGWKQTQYIFEQGYNLNRISKIYVDIKSSHDVITDVYVGGYGYVDTSFTYC